MNGMWKRIVDRVFYDPSRHVERLGFVARDSGCVLLPTARFDFRQGEKSFLGSIRLGRDSMLGCNFLFETDRGEVSIGQRTFINAGTKIITRERVTIGSDVTIAWDVTLYDHNSHSLDWRHRAEDIKKQLDDYRSGRSFVASKDWSTVKARPIVICDKSWIGFDCIILSGVVIGEGAIVGAGSVVRDNVSPWTVVAGNPAVPIRTIQP